MQIVFGISLGGKSSGFDTVYSESPSSRIPSVKLELLPPLDKVDRMWLIPGSARVNTLAVGPWVEADELPTIRARGNPVDQDYLCPFV